MKIIILIILVVFLNGCSVISTRRNPIYLWDDISEGKLKGKIHVQWISADKYIYFPDDNDPLMFERSNGEIIEPKAIYTDGGSVPRVAWIAEGFSPWRYAPAYIVHDWLFEVNHCKLQKELGYKYDHVDAAEIMAEIIKTQLIKEN